MNRQSGLLYAVWLFIRPTALNIFVYGMIVLGMLGMLAYRLLTNQVLVDPSLNSSTEILQANISHYSHALNSSGTLATVLSFSFWMVIGAITYIIIWSGLNALVDTYNDVVISEVFLHPRSFHKSSYWLAILSRTIARVAGVFLLFIYILYWVQALFPFWQDLMGYYLHQLPSILPFFLLIFTICGTVLTLHVFSVLTRIVLLRVPTK